MTSASSLQPTLPRRSQRLIFKRFEFNPATFGALLSDHYLRLELMSYLDAESFFALVCTCRTLLLAACRQHDQWWLLLKQSFPYLPLRREGYPSLVLTDRIVRGFYELKTLCRLARPTPYKYGILSLSATGALVVWRPARGQERLYTVSVFLRWFEPRCTGICTYTTKSDLVVFEDSCIPDILLFKGDCPECNKKHYSPQMYGLRIYDTGTPDKCLLLDATDGTLRVTHPNFGYAVPYYKSFIMTPNIGAEPIKTVFTVTLDGRCMVVLYREHTEYLSVLIDNYPRLNTRDQHTGDHYFVGARSVVRFQFNPIDCSVVRVTVSPIEPPIELMGTASVSGRFLVSQTWDGVIFYDLSVVGVRSGAVEGVVQSHMPKRTLTQRCALSIQSGGRTYMPMFRRVFGRLREDTHEE